MRGALLAACLEGLTHAAGHTDRREVLKRYWKGPLLPGQRTSTEPIAAPLHLERGQAALQSLHHLMGEAPWSDEAVLAQVRPRALPGIEQGGGRGLDRR